MGSKKLKIAKNIKEMAFIAEAILKDVVEAHSSKAVVLALSGELGAGKTSLTQNIARLLGVKNRVSSPTFVIMKRYPLFKKSFKYLFHLDAYRLKNEKELLSLGWKEIVGNKDNIVIIEWPERVSRAIPKNAYKVSITHHKDGGRAIKTK